MKHKIYVDGQNGTTGLKIFDRLAAREDIEVLKIEEEKRKDLSARLEMVNQADITFLCLPDAASKEIAAAAPASARLIDTSTAHRTLDSWAYGMPELGIEQAEKIKNSNRVAVPGCHATGFVMLAYPLITCGIADADYPFTCHSVTGFSGGGKSMIAEYGAEDRDIALSSPRQYGLTQTHKHLPEMKAIPGLTYAPVFNPIVADYMCGMVVTIPLHNRLLKVQNPELIRDVLAQFYKGNKLITVHPFAPTYEEGFIAANALAGKDTLEIFVCGHGEQTVLISRFDNLGKGSSGAAVECMNLMLGLAPETGLEV